MCHHGAMRQKASVQVNGIVLGSVIVGQGPGATNPVVMPSTGNPLYDLAIGAGGILLAALILYLCKRLRGRVAAFVTAARAHMRSERWAEENRLDCGCRGDKTADTSCGRCNDHCECAFDEMGPPVAFPKP